MPTGLRLRDLGTLRIEFEGRSVTGGASAGGSVGGRKPAAILSALLVSPNRRVSRDVLVDAAWGDRSADEAATLETHIWRLRKVLEPDRDRGESPTFLVNDSGGYRLALNAENADSLRFAQLAEQGDGLLMAGDSERAVGRYESALALWRGRPFEAVADEPWALAAVARLEERHAQVQEQYVEALLRCGREASAVVVLEELIASTPLRERVWSQLMLARYRTGRTDDALATFRRARTVLLDELGLEPGPVLRDLHQRILDHDPTLLLVPSGHAPALVSAAADPTDETAGPVALPRRLDAFVGRDAELSRLTRLTASTPLVTVVGPAGAGKTRLAIEAARMSAGDASDGVWFIDLTAVEDASDVADLIASTLHIAAPVVGDTTSLLRTYLRDRRVLLVLDNCEHLLPDVGDLVEDLLAEGGEGRVLATSREPTGAAGEVLWTLGPLATRDSAGSASARSPAAELFVARVRSLDAGTDFPASPDDVERVEAICSAVDGMPLAIELAAGRIRSSSLPEILAQTTAGLADLARVGRGRVDHHQTIERSIEWGVRLLTDRERAVHARLSVLPGVFTVEAARAVAGGDLVESDSMPEILAALVHRSLLDPVRPVAPGRPTRYRQLATVRAHAARALGTSDVYELALTHRTRVVLDLLEALPPLGDVDADGAYARLDQNHDTVTAVLQHTLVDRPDQVGLTIAAGLSGYWGLYTRFLEMQRWGAAALAQPGGDARDRVVAQLAHASLQILRGRADLGADLIVGCLHEIDLIPPKVRMYLLFGIAIQSLVRGDPSIPVVDEQITRLAATGDPCLVVYRDVVSAWSEITTSRPEVSQARGRALRDRADSLGLPMAAWLAATLGSVSSLLIGDATAGRELFKEARAANHSLGATHEEVYLEQEAAFEVIDGDAATAVRLLSASRAMSFRAGIPWPVTPTATVALERVRQALPVEEFEAAWRAGQAAV